MASPSTAKRRLADTLLPGGLSAFVSSERAAGQSWRAISLTIRDRIDLDIHPRTLSAWFAEDMAAAS